MVSPILQLTNISKSFGHVQANKNINLIINKGTIHGIIGENGAGKSTLMSIVYGLYQADSGTIKVNEKEIKLKSPRDSIENGIGMVHQHFMLVENFTVLENIVLGFEGEVVFGKNLEKAKTDLKNLCETYNLNVDLKSVISDLSVGFRQRVEILKSLYRGAEVFILDEPTGVLTPQEVDELFKILRSLKEEGKTIVLITHKLNEIMDLTSEVSVMRQGEIVGHTKTETTNREKLAEMMVGRKIEGISLPKKKKGDIVLEVKNLVVPSKTHKKNAVNNVSFEVHQGEIVCVAGIEGNGQSELVYGITGLEKCSSGEIFLKGQDITKMSIRERNLTGITHIPEDRHKHGLVLDFTLENNLDFRSSTSPLIPKYFWNFSVVV